MYVCVCNSVRSGEVKEALKQGNHSVGALRRHFQFKTCCGACTGCMRSMIEDHSQSDCHRAEVNH